MTDIVERLRGWIREMEDGLPWEAYGSKGFGVLREAAETIEHLRDRLANSIAISGKAELGASFSVITKDLPRAPKDLCGND